jgi:hypothetical protein
MAAPDTFDFIIVGGIYPSLSYHPTAPDTIQAEQQAAWSRTGSPMPRRAPEFSSSKQAQIPKANFSTLPVTAIMP